MCAYAQSFFNTGLIATLWGAVIGRCAAVDVVRSTVRGPALKRESRDCLLVLQSERRCQSLCSKTAISGFRVQLIILYVRVYSYSVKNSSYTCCP